MWPMAARGNVLLSIPHSSEVIHNGGLVTFGPDGYLYIGTGDGGGAGDPGEHGQDSTVLLGKILRVDVDGGFPYAIPASNPFAGRSGADEVWAYGLRNPWRFSFDRLTQDLYIADVGEVTWEEIDFAPAGDPGGHNYGWDQMEGTHCHEPMTGCETSGKVLPVYEYSHASRQLLNHRRLRLSRRPEPNTGRTLLLRRLLRRPSAESENGGGRRNRSAGP